jgi:hypothetical protein
MPRFPALGRLMQDDLKFKAGLNYIVSLKKKKKKKNLGQASMSHAYNPSYSGGRVRGQPGPGGRGDNRETHSQKCPTQERASEVT